MYYSGYFRAIGLLYTVTGCVTFCTTLLIVNTHTMRYTIEQIRPYLETAVQPHNADPTSTRRANLIGTRLRYNSSHHELYFRVGGRFVWFRASGGAKFPEMERVWTNLQHLTPLALSWPEKSVTVQNFYEQTNKHKKTVNDIFTPYLSCCVDNKLDVAMLRSCDM